jgi:hypothetical protein
MMSSSDERSATAVNRLQSLAQVICFPFIKCFTTPQDESDIVTVCDSPQFQQPLSLHVDEEIVPEIQRGRIPSSSEINPTVVFGNLSIRSSTRSTAEQSKAISGQRLSHVKPPAPSTPLSQVKPTPSTPLLTSRKLNSYVPTRWSNNLQQQQDFFLSDLSPNDTDYEIIESKFNEYYPKHIITIDRIQVIENKYLWLMFQLKKEEMISLQGFCHEKHLFHGTKASNIDLICSNNFNWRFFGRNRGFKFGEGVSFSPRSSYASHFSDQNINGNNKMFLVRVLQCKVSYVGLFPPALPPYGFDTTCNVKGTVIVKYDDNTFYPEYLITYTGTCP